MYIAGHLLASAVAATVIHKKLKTDLVPLCTGMMAVNFVDVDHVLNYAVDNGIANSLTLHPLHIYSGILFFIIGLFGLWKTKYMNYCYGLLFALAMHYAGDALAHLFNYNMVFLGLLDISLLITLYFLLIRNSNNPQSSTLNPIRWILFFIGVFITGNGIQMFQHFVLHMKPDESPWMYATAAICNIVIPTVFYILFRKRTQN